MTTQEAVDFIIQMIAAGKTGVEQAFDPSNPDPYYCGYKQGYIAGLESALKIINRYRLTNEREVKP